MSLIEKLNEWLIARSPVYLLEFSGKNMRWCEGSWKDNNFDIRRLQPAEIVYESTQPDALPDIASTVKQLRAISGYRFPFEKHAAIILPDHFFTFGSFQVPAVAARSGLQAFLEREIHKTTTLSFKDFHVRYEFGEKRENRIPVQYCAISKIRMQTLFKITELSGIVPVSVQPAFTGLTRALRAANVDARHPSVFVHLGEKTTTTGIFNREGLLAIHTIDRGVNDLLLAVKTARNCNNEEALNKLTDEIVLLEDPNCEAQGEIETYQNIEAVLIDLLQKIYGFLLLFSNDHPEESGFLKIILSGEGTKIRNIDRLINANLGIPTTFFRSEIDTMVSALSLPEKETASTIATLLGNLMLAPWQLERYDRIMAA